MRWPDYNGVGDEVVLSSAGAALVLGLYAPSSLAWNLDATAVACKAGWW